MSWPKFRVIAVILMASLLSGCAIYSSAPTAAIRTAPTYDAEIAKVHRIGLVTDATVVYVTSDNERLSVKDSRFVATKAGGTK